MINESPHAASMRTHLNSSQCRVEQAISAAKNAVQSLRDCPNDNGRWLSALEQLDELRRHFDEHVARVAGEGILEDVVARRPALYLTMQTIEVWQSQLGDQLNRIADLLRRWQGDADQLTAIAEALNDYRVEFEQEEREERHVVDRGLA